MQYWTYLMFWECEWKWWSNVVLWKWEKVKFWAQRMFSLQWDSELFNSAHQLMRHFSSYITCIDELISDKSSMQSNWGDECFQKASERLLLISPWRCQLITVSVSASASVSVSAVRASVWAFVCASLYAFVSSLELLRSLMLYHTLCSEL